MLVDPSADPAVDDGHRRGRIHFRDKEERLLELYTRAARPAVAWAALVEVQAAGARELRRQVVDRYVHLL